MHATTDGHHNNAQYWSGTLSHLCCASSHVLQQVSFIMYFLTSRSSFILPASFCISEKLASHVSTLFRRCSTSSSLRSPRKHLIFHVGQSRSPTSWNVPFLRSDFLVFCPLSWHSPYNLSTRMRVAKVSSSKSLRAKTWSSWDTWNREIRPSGIWWMLHIGEKGKGIQVYSNILSEWPKLLDFLENN